MYIEVEPGLIAVHTSPEDIVCVAILYSKKKREGEEDELTAHGYDYVRMLTTGAPRWTKASLQPRLYYKNRTHQKQICKV